MGVTTRSTTDIRGGNYDTKLQTSLFHEEAAWGRVEPEADVCTETSPLAATAASVRCSGSNNSRSVNPSAKASRVRGSVHSSP